MTLLFVGGTIRWVSQSPAVWELLDDTGHEPVNLGTVTCMPDRVRVAYSFPPGVTAGKVVAFHATWDEGFAASNVRTGPSVGLSYVDVFFYMGTTQTPVDPKYLSKGGANVWLTGWFLASE